MTCFKRLENSVKEFDVWFSENAKAISFGSGIGMFVTVLFAWLLVTIRDLPPQPPQKQERTTFLRVVDDGNGGLWVSIPRATAKEYCRRREATKRNELPVGSDCVELPDGSLGEIPPPQPSPEADAEFQRIIEENKKKQRPETLNPQPSGILLPQPSP
ncbi:MAG: hypothetical protein ACJ8C4_16510 [Gemmataceae bacterium]